MSKPRISATLRLSGEFEPNDVSAMLGSAPTVVWREGDKVAGTDLRRRESGWAISLPEREEDDLNLVLVDLLRVIAPYRSQVSSVAKRLDLQVEVSLGVYVNDESPAGYFTASSIAELARLGAVLDVDITIGARRVGT